MIKILQEYGLDEQGITQHDVEFVDLYLGVDNELYLDFNKIFIADTLIHHQMRADIEMFMSLLFQYLSQGQHNDLEILLDGLHETNATCLGMTDGKPDGNSVGDELKERIQDNLTYLVDAFRNGIRNIEALYFGIPGIGPDRISDIITSIVKRRLITFTQQQCNLYGIEVETHSIPKLYDMTFSTWFSEDVDLPSFEGDPIIFIPKDILSSYKGMTGTLDKFIRYAFNNFFRHSDEYKNRVRGNRANTDDVLRRKEFDEYNKEHGIGKKALSREFMTQSKNRLIIETFADIRDNIILLSNEELSQIIEDKYLDNTQE